MADVLTVNKQELADLFGVSVPTVDTWIKQGCPVEREGSNGVPYAFDAVRVRVWREERDEAERQAQAERDRQIGQMQLEMTGGSAGAEGTTVLTAEQRLKAAQAALAEDKLARERRELIPVDEVRQDYEAVFQMLRQRLGTLDVLLARTAALTPDQAAKVKIEVRGLMVDLGKQIADPNLRPGEDA